MAQYDVACAALVAMSSVTEESSSHSTLENTANSGVTPVVGFGEPDIVDDGPTEITENSILAELGMIERYDGRRNVGEAETQRVASGTLSAAQVHPADVPVGSEVQFGYGAPGQGSVVVQTSFATLEDGSVRAVPKGGFAADGLVTGSSPARLDDSAAGAVLKDRFATAFAAAAENPFVREVRHNREYQTLACRESGGAPRECPQERVSVNPFASASSYMPPQPPMPNGNSSLLPLLGQGGNEELITIPKRMYYELLESKQHAERMLTIIAQLEAQCVQHQQRLDACSLECRLTCERVLEECESKCKEFETRCVQYEQTCIKANEQTEKEIMLIRAECHDRVLREQTVYETRIRELESKVYNLERAKTRDVHDWYNDTSGHDPTYVHENTQAFHIGEDTEPPKTSVSVGSFQSCHDFNSKVARLLHKYDDKQTDTVRSKAVHSDSTVVYQDGVGPQSRVLPGGAFGANSKPVGVAASSSSHVVLGDLTAHAGTRSAFGANSEPAGAAVQHTFRSQEFAMHDTRIHDKSVFVGSVTGGAFGANSKPVGDAVVTQSAFSHVHGVGVGGAFGANSKPSSDQVPNAAFSHVQAAAVESAFGANSKPFNDRVTNSVFVSSHVQLSGSASGANSGPAIGQDPSHARSQHLKSHVLTPDSKGRDSPVNPFVMGNSFVRNDEVRHSDHSPFLNVMKDTGNGDTANGRPVTVPPLPIFQNDRSQNHVHEHSTPFQHASNSSAFGANSKPAGPQFFVGQAGYADGAFGANSKPAQNHGPLPGDHVGAFGANSKPNIPEFQNAEHAGNMNPQHNNSFSFSHANAMSGEPQRSSAYTEFHSDGNDIRSSQDNRHAQNPQSTRNEPQRNRRSSDDSGDDDVGSQSETARRRPHPQDSGSGPNGPRRKIKVDPIELDHMPDPGHLRQWRVDMREKVTDAYAVDPDAALKWIKEVDSATSVDQLAANPYPELEVQLAKAMKKCIKHNRNFHAKISQLIEQGQLTGTRVTSRQIIFLMYEYLRPDTRGESMYDLQDLFHVKLDANPRKCNVEELAHFLLRWDTCLTGIGRKVDPDTMYTLFMSQIEDIELIEWEMKAFDKLPDKDKTYESLYAICEDLIIKERKKKNSKQLHTRSRQTPLHVAAPAPLTDAAPAPGKSSHRRSSSGSYRGRARSSSSRGSRHRSGGRHGSKSRSYSRSGSRGKNKHRSASRKRTCIDFLKGKCTRGAGCKYSHDKDGKGSRSPTRRDRTSDNKTRKPSRSPSNKPKAKCILFSQGKCTYGSKCKYAHDSPAAPATPTRADASNRSANSPAPGQSFP